MRNRNYRERTDLKKRNSAMLHLLQDILDQVGKLKGVNLATHYGHEMARGVYASAGILAEELTTLDEKQQQQQQRRKK